LQILDRPTEVTVVSVGDHVEGVLFVLDILPATDIPQDRNDRACGYVAELDVLAGVAQSARHLVELVGDQHDRLAGVFDQLRDRRRAAAVVGAVDVVGLIKDDELAALGVAAARAATARTAGQGGVVCRPAGKPLDHVGGSLVGGVEFDRLPAHIRGQRVGRGGLADPRRAIEDHRLPVVVPRCGPLVERIAGFVVAANLREGRRAVAFGPISHYRDVARRLLSGCDRGCPGSRADSFRR